MRFLPGPRPASVPRSRGSRGWRERSRQAAVALALVAATFVAGPLPTSTAAADPAPAQPVAVAPGPAVERQAEQALGARLATEYAGAVPAADVDRLVRRVVRQLRSEASPPERLLRTAEGVCRRALTDFLARGVPLAVG